MSSSSVDFWRVRKIAKSEYKLPHTCLYVRMDTTCFPLNGFSLNLIFEHFLPKIRRGNSSFMKI